MKPTKQEILFLFLLAGSYFALTFIYRLLNEIIEPKQALVLFTSFYGFVLMTFFLLYRKGTINFSIFNNEENYRKKSSKVGIFVSCIIIMQGYLVYYLPYDQARIFCDILLILACIAILINLLHNIG
ncbi:hypothetical protein JCM14036_21480 [Desulfotomaculum defluvii]